jgi:hypothetical protein
MELSIDIQFFFLGAAADWFHHDSFRSRQGHFVGSIIATTHVFIVQGSNFPLSE